MALFRQPRGRRAQTLRETHGIGGSRGRGLHQPAMPRAQWQWQWHQAVAACGRQDSVGPQEGSGGPAEAMSGPALSVWVGGKETPCSLQ